ncbi:hypothetical protein TevJSym_ak00600 [endosymbiont of Tevnia jerichonana (vent Tica)]|uniref:Uncharacterized protein n=1 Tax=endosymbiont of Tevnia jerichonana (vent Tica) TaxID=1049564 RepID=G2FF49_9GAMM|nr:hypothetical protein TevJSym_ak00600 [endosymbiont of Tevnia jerichonana (vent Tica)]
MLHLLPVCMKGVGVDPGTERWRAAFCRSLSWSRSRPRTL